MHFKNGREAKNGDKVVLQPEYPKDANGRSLALPVIGILYDATPGIDTCNGRIAHVTPHDPCPNLQDCLHLDDFLAALPAEVPSTAAPISAAAVAGE